MIIGVTAGDSCGIGPEVLLKAYMLHEIKPPVVVFGDLDILDYYNDLLGYGIAFRKIADPSAYEEGYLNVLDAGILRRRDLTIGKVNAASGRAARDYVIAATKCTLAGKTDAMVTLPMNKEATQLSDPRFVGHTELIGELCGAREVTIMLASEHLIVTHVSTHVSLAKAIEMVRRERICTIIRLTWEAVRKLRENPRLAVAGLNPHAGESGLFGDQEITEIRPAVEWAQNQGIPIEGPFPPDTVFYMAVRRKRFDAVVCMYHDQGHIPLKVLDFEGGVNIALGLPIVRTSVDHGTAFDIAGRGMASTASFVRALDLAVRLA
ncbi:MAG: 4-hydroxythreonine-4-phosphate dehydrogenase PdxA [Acidobacteria bacterium]|nr:4-hydroxythreonine-4-phosphate dehydrogenase PdxA [Acidobacteriota bacterium]